MALKAAIAVATPVAVASPVGSQSVRGIQRLLGTAVGLVLYAGILAWGPEGLWLAALLFSRRRIS